MILMSSYILICLDEDNQLFLLSPIFLTREDLGIVLANSNFFIPMPDLIYIFLDFSLFQHGENNFFDF